jgi:triacylglycerol esterase/lipase EstA (alpha/beta hydrolase family)
MSLIDAMVSEAETFFHQLNHLYMDQFHPYGKQPRNGRTVIIIPGYLAPSFAMRGMADFLRDKEYRPIRWIHKFWESLETNVDKFSKDLEKYYLEQNRQVYMIGHSLGGLILRDVLSRVPQVAKSAVFLGSPHKGTNAAYMPLAYLTSKSCREMVPGSKYLQQLQDKSLPDIPITNIVTKYDEFVVPWQNALLPESNNVKNVILEDVAHLSITDSKIFNIVFDSLHRSIAK